MSIEDEISDMFNEIEMSEIQDNLDELQWQGKMIAKANGWNFTKFKAALKEHFGITKPEDDTVWDYNSWLYGMARMKRFEDPLEWAKEYYEL